MANLKKVSEKYTLIALFIALTAITIVSVYAVNTANYINNLLS